MATYVPAKRATEFIFYVGLVSQSNTKTLQSNPTLAAGDVLVSKDGGATANLTTLPTVTPASGKQVKVTVSSTEMTADNVTITFSDAAGAEWCDLIINIQTAARQIDDLTYPNTSGRGIDVDATGGVEITVNQNVNVAQWNGTNVAAPATAGVPSVDVVYMSGDSTAADKLEAWVDGMLNNTAQAGAAGSITLNAGASAVDDFYKGQLITLTGGTGVGQVRLITGYTGSTKVATVSPNWATNPDNTSTFITFPHGRSDLWGVLGTVLSTPATAGILDVNVKNMNNVAATSITTINANQGTTQPVNFTGTGASALAKSDMVDVAGAAVSTSTAQIGVNAVNIGGTAQTGRDIGASVLLSSGTGTGQLDFTSGVVKANLAQILGTALTETAGQIAAAFKKFFDKATPTGTINSIPDAVAGAAGGLFIAGTNAATVVTTSLTTTFTGNLTGSVGSVTGAVGSVTGAVGSVTGNVGGNVTGSVGSIATGGIAAASFAAGAIDAAAIAANAIGASELASDAVTEIRSLASGTSDSGSTTTMVDAARTEADTDYWRGQLIVFTSGNVAGQARVITAFDPATDTITFAPATTQAISTQTYEIWAAGDYLRPTTSGRTLDVSAGGEAGLDWANIGSPTTAQNLSATNIDVDQVVASVTGAVGSVTGAVGSVTGNVGGNVVGSVGSVTGAVGSVTGNVGGNVTGSVGSIATGGIAAASFAAGAIDAAAIAANAIGASELAADAVTEIQSGLATAASIAALNNLSAAQVNAEVDTALADVRLDELLAADSDIDGAAPPTVGSVFHELMTKTVGSFTYDQTTDSLEAIRDKETDIEADTQDIQTQIGAAGAGLSAVPWNAAWDAEVQSEVQDALEANNLDHLVGTATGIPAIPSGTFLDQIMDDGTATFDRTTDSLQAIRDRGDAAWTTGGGGSITDVLNVVPLIPPSVDLANTATWRLGLMLTNALDDLPTTAEITPGTISIDRKTIGATSWTSIVSDAACSESAGMVYYDAAFNSGAGYAEGDSLQITFKSQKITVAANDYEITDSTGRIFYSEIRQTERGTNSALLAASYTAPDNSTIATINSKIGTPAGASVSADVAAVKVETAAILADTGTDGVVLAAGSITAAVVATDAIDADALAANAVAEIQSGLATAASIAALNNLSAAQVNAEVVDALNVDTYAEPGQGAPAATTSLAEKLNYLYKAWRNRHTQTSTQFSLYADNGTTLDQKATVSDDNTTFDRGELESGP